MLALHVSVSVSGSNAVEFNDLLLKAGIDNSKCLVLRHRPPGRAFRKLLPWLVVERPDIFNCYQQTQSPQCEVQMMRAQTVASFIGHEPGKAIFAGLYAMKGFEELSRQKYQAKPVVQEERRLQGISDRPINKKSVVWFDLELTEFHLDWQGKLVIQVLSRPQGNFRCFGPFQDLFRPVPIAHTRGSVAAQIL